MIRKAIITITLLCCLLFWGVSIGINRLVESAVTDYLKDTCLVNGTLSEAKISLLSGEAVLYDLRIDNPKGFPSGSALAVRSIRLAFKPDILFNSPFTLREVVLDEPVVLLSGPVDEDNILEIGRNLTAAIRVYAMDLHHKRSDPLIRIENMYTVDGMLKSKDTGPEPVRLPTLLLSQVGGSKGLPLSKVVMRLLTLLDNAANTAKLAALPEEGGMGGGEEPAGAGETPQPAQAPQASKTSKGPAGK